MIQHQQDKKSYGIFTKDEFERMQKMTASERIRFTDEKKKELANKDKKRRW